jgi:uncharacterized membrane protein YkvA (DUF1232 family)
VKTFDVLLQEDIQTYEGRHDDLIYQAPALYRLLTHLLDDPALPGRLRGLVLAAIAYFILPADIIPEDVHGPYGYVDDIFLTAFVADVVRREIRSDNILVVNWDGEALILPLITDILAEEKNLIGDERERILSYIGYAQLGV